MVADIKAVSLSVTASSLGPIESKRWVNELHTTISVNGNRVVIVLRHWAGHNALVTRCHSFGLSS